MKKKSYQKAVLAGGILLAVAAFSIGHPGHHPQHHHHSREVVFPDVPGFVTLSSDFHIHTVFSDGLVWPVIRVQEALRDNIDAISITDHLEYMPFRGDIPTPDRNRPYELARASARNTDLIVINGAEITRSMPPGHSNAIFLEDVNKLDVPDAREAYEAARAQGAFIFWDHPSWLAQASDGIPPFSDMHRSLIEDDLLHGIEVVNMHTYSREALQIAIDHDLTVMATSDIHGLVDWDFDIEGGGHRPVTLIFAEERSEQGIKEALFAGRTVAWMNDYLIGKKEHMVPLLEQSLQVVQSSYIPGRQVLRLGLQNVTSTRMIIENRSEWALHEHTSIVIIEPYEQVTLQVKTLEVLDEVRFPIRVLNAVIAPETYAEIEIHAVVE
jgi:predicted metal-dependent phosphoesterase TrpH